MPPNLELNGDIAVDTETKGLRIFSRDRLCVVQLSDGSGDAHLVQFSGDDYNKADNLKKILSDDSNCKIFHYARFDLAVIKMFLDVDITNIYCTKIASKLSRTYTDHHGLKHLCRELLGVDISKQQQCSDWGAKDLSQAQQQYAASDVLYLHDLREKLNSLLECEGRTDLANKCFEFLSTRVELDIRGWPEDDIFSHS